MILRLMKYGGVSAKVRAMYGKRLTAGDYASIKSAGSVSAVASYLKNTGWSDALKRVFPATVTREELESALRVGVYDEYTRIYKFMSREDHPMMDYMLEKLEIDEIFDFTRCLSVGKPDDYQCHLPDFYRRHSRLDFDRFTSCRNFGQFITFLTGSQYYKPLERLFRENGGVLPEQPLIEVVLNTQYFSRIFSIIKKNYSRDVALALERGFGMQIDMMNIASIIRIKQYFPNMNDEILSYLLPFYHRLRPAFISKLISAQSAGDVFDLLKTSGYRKLFSENSFASIDAYTTRQLYSFYRKILLSAAPSVLTPIAYMYVRGTEVTNIINITECIYYGVGPDEAGIYLTF